MSDTFIDNTWDRILNLPDAPMADFNRELAGYTFDTHGTGDDYEVGMFPPADRLLDTLPALSGLSRPSFPFIDLSTMPDKTPKPRAALTIMGPPPTPTPTSHFVLKDLNTFPPVHMDFSMMEGTPLHPDDFCIAADRKRGLYNNETRALIGNSGTERVKRLVGRPKKVKENVSPTDDASTTSKAHYNGDDLISIAHAVVDVNPFIAPYGKKGIAWQEVVDKLVDQNFCHKAVNVVTVQHKAEALISYKKDPLSKHKNLANVIGDGKSAVRLVLALRPAHRLMAPSTESRTRTYEAPVHPNRESKLPNPVSHQTHAAYAPHPTLHITSTTRPTMVQPPLNALIVRNPFPRVRTPHTSAALHATAHENGTDQPIAGILGLVSSSHTQEVTNTRTQASSGPVSTHPSHSKPTHPGASSNQ
ncbi:hypothetical protein B0H13DRAFT_2329632 [Mycena leptocephala]|nr:hypothetical protein B0H13DRAFT_2329632 [Mycena leptocephala]